MPVIHCNLKSKACGEFELASVLGYETGVDRPATTTGDVGSYGHDIRELRITRRKSVRGNGAPQIEEESVQLAAQVGDQAYFSGDLTLARANAPNQIIQRLAWDEGHITSISWEVLGEEIVEKIQICVKKLTIENSTFTRGLDSDA